MNIIFISCNWFSKNCNISKVLYIILGQFSVEVSSPNDQCTTSTINTFENVRGEITSLDYPNRGIRKKEVECTWLITSGVGKRIKIRFEDFQLAISNEDTHNLCTWDYFQVFDGLAVTSNRLTERLCGVIDKLPFNHITSSRNHIRVEWNSRGPFKYKGFKI